jgi:hypothetical protein
LDWRTTTDAAIRIKKKGTVVRLETRSLTAPEGSYCFIGASILRCIAEGICSILNTLSFSVFDVEHTLLYDWDLLSNGAMSQPIFTCAICGLLVPLEEAQTNAQGQPVHGRCAAQKQADSRQNQPESGKSK